MDADLVQMVDTKALDGVWKLSMAVSSDDAPLQVDRVLGKRIIPNESLDPFYFIKWRGKSYLHCSWERAEDVELIDEQGKIKIVKFNINSPESDPRFYSSFFEYFDPEMCSVQRVLACGRASTFISHIESMEKFIDSIVNRSDNPSDIENSTLYLVKWKGLPYTEATWERFDDVCSFYAEFYAFWRLQRLDPSYLSSPESHTFDVSALCAASSLASVQLSVDHKSGIEWLVRNHLAGHSCLLNDACGSGKILTLIGFINVLLSQKINKFDGPILVFMPAHRFNQWMLYFERCCPDVSVVLYYGRGEKERELIRKIEVLSDNGLNFDVMITSYETATRDAGTLKLVSWRSIIVDEAHRLRNVHSKMHLALRKLTAPHHIFTSNVLCSKIEDIWPLFCFADTERYGEIESFESDYNRILSKTDSNGCVEDEMVLRRSAPARADAETFLMTLPLLPTQQSVLKLIIEDSANLLIGADTASERDLKKIVYEMLLCCAHPLLVQSQYKRLVEGDASASTLYEISVKLSALDLLLRRLVKEKRKVVLCSQYQPVLDILDAQLKAMQVLYERADMQMSLPERSAAATRFSKDLYERVVLLLSTQQAPSQVIDLSCADVVIFFDSDPTVDWLRLNRLYKIGLHKPVSIHRIVCENSIESLLVADCCLSISPNDVSANGGSSAINLEVDSSTASANAMSDAINRLSLSAVLTLLRQAAYIAFCTDSTRLLKLDELTIRVNDSMLPQNQLSSQALLNTVEFPDSLSDEKFWVSTIGLVLADIKISKVSRKRKPKGESDVVEVPAIFEDAVGKKKRSSSSRVQEKAFQWGARSRDKVISCLLMFGFGRWNKILAMSGIKNLPTSELDILCKTYILKCTYVASEMPAHESDTLFVRDAIEAAQQVKAKESAGDIVLSIPLILQDEKLTNRLRHKNSAKRIITTVGVMMRLEKFLELVCLQCLKKKGRGRKDYEDVDDMLTELEIPEICDSMSIASKTAARSRSLRRMPWWDGECDKHMLIGVFIHGYGRFDLIKKDPKLCFAGILESLALNREAVLAEAQGTSSNSTSAEAPASSDATASVGLAGEARGAETQYAMDAPMAPMEVASEVEFSTLDADQELHLDSGTMDQDLHLEAGAMEEGADGGDEIGGDDDNEDDSAYKDGMPDTRFLNRLVALLVCPDMLGPSAVHGEAGPSIAPTATSPDVCASPLKDVSEIVPAAPRSPSRTPVVIDKKPSDRSKKNPFGEAYLLSNLADFLDQNAVTLCFTSYGYQLCKDVVERSIPKKNSDPSSKEATQGMRIVLDEEEISKICSAFVLYGAPLVSDKTTTASSSGEYAVYDWKHFVHKTGISLQPKHVRHFYETCWLPFCGTISLKEIKFSNKRVLPNPLVKPADHSLVTRGLCQMFLARQRLLRIIQYIIAEAKDVLLGVIARLHSQTGDISSWWISPLHDIALLGGCLSFGYMAVDAMRASSSHLFHPQKLSALIRSSNPTLALDTFEVKFPSSEVLERRLLSILEEIATGFSKETFDRIFANEASQSSAVASSADLEGTI